MERVTLGKTGITVNKNGFGALPIQRISTEDAVTAWRERHMMQASLFLIPRGSIRTARRSLEKRLRACGKKSILRPRRRHANADEFWEQLGDFPAQSAHGLY